MPELRGVLRKKISKRRQKTKTGKRKRKAAPAKAAKKNPGKRFRISRHLSRKVKPAKKPKKLIVKKVPRRACWEYRIVKGDSSDKSRKLLNRIGSQGWDMVSAAGQGKKISFVFKRKI